MDASLGIEDEEEVTKTRLERCACCRAMIRVIWLARTMQAIRNLVDRALKVLVTGDDKLERTLFIPTLAIAEMCRLAERRWRRT
jgi:hypothetical protein